MHQSKSASPIVPQSVELVPFTSLGLAEPILEALTQEGYETPTPIQAQTIPAALAGRDVLGCAQTGTGKTAAFALPILHKLISVQGEEMVRERRPRALILSPTRELATQIAVSFRTYGRHTRVNGTTIFGGVSQRGQVRDLQRGVDVIVATPGRLLDLLEQGYVDLSAIETFVLDEADRMLDMGFINPIREIASKLPAAGGRQTLLFSATMPREIQKLAESLLTNPVRVAVAAVAATMPKIEQRLFMVPRIHKLGLLLHLLDAEKATRAVVFTKTKHGADKLCRRLERANLSATAIHGNKAQNQRDRALDSFREGRSRILVATDVAARGLDVDGISHVFNFDLPMEPEAYVHRIGRTGRAGATGIAISFCDREERDLLRQVERFTKAQIPTFPLPKGVELDTPKDEPDHRDERRDDRGGDRDYSRPLGRGFAQRQGRPDHPRSEYPRADRPRATPFAAAKRVPPHHPEHPAHSFHATNPAPVYPSSNKAARFNEFVDESAAAPAPRKAPRPIERVAASGNPHSPMTRPASDGRGARPAARPGKPRAGAPADAKHADRPKFKPKAGDRTQAPKGPNPDKGRPKWAKGGKARSIKY